MAATQSGSHVFRYEQNPKPLSSYQGDADDGYDGVTVQWFESMDDYKASIEAPDVGEVMADVAKFLDVDHLEFVVTENPNVVIDGVVPPGGGVESSPILRPGPGARPGPDSHLRALQA
jgi:hypothetical protein